MKKLGALAVLLLTLGAQAPSTHSPADLVLRNGKIYTMDTARSWAEAIAIKNGRIVYVGDEAGLTPWVGAKTQTIDLHRRMVMPSFNDAHVHPVEAGVGMNRCALDQAKTKDEALAIIKKYAEEHPKATWVVGQGWQLPLFPQANPQKEWLDAIVPDRPVYLSAADGHSAWANSKALQLAHITKDTKDPENGRIERNQNGEPTGTLRESATDLVYDLVPHVSEAEEIAGLQSALKVMNGFGITGFQDASVSIEGKDPEARGSANVYREADRKGLLTARVTGALYADPEGSLSEVMKQLTYFEKTRREYQGKYFSPTAVKIFADGVIESETAALLQPYLDKPNYSGDLNWAPEKLNAFIDALYERKFQIHIHAIGDRAIRASLSAIEAAEKHHGMRDARSVIAHLELIDPADVPRFQQLRVIPCFQPIWAYADTYIKDLTLPILGPQRSRWIYPMRSVLDHGATLALGSDWNVSSVNPLDGIEVAVTRQDPDAPPDADNPFIPEERIDLPTTLAGYTIGSAYSNFWEKETGSLEAGKSADLIVLSQNLFDIPPSQINQTKVLLTLLEGRAIFKSPDFAEASK
jgi:predicted amidohydrolase YtcJ